MKKKGLESMEVWMWLIAGLILGGLIFSGGFYLLANWIHNKEVNLASDSYYMLKSSILNVCRIGLERQETEKYVFPRIVKNITISNGTDYGQGHILCMDIKDEKLNCEDLGDECSYLIYMDSVSFENKESLFYVIKKATGQSQAVRLRFRLDKSLNEISKEPEIHIAWDEEYITE